VVEWIHMEIRMLDKKTISLKGKKENVLINPEEAFLKKELSRIVLYTSDKFGHGALLGNKILIQGAGEYEVGGVEIYGYNAEDGNTVYVVQVDGVKLVVLGGLNKPLSDKKVEKIDSADVLITPTKMENGLSFKLIKDWAKKWGINYLVPVGDDDESLKEFLDAADEEGLEPVDLLKIEQSDLPDGLEIKLLKKV